MKFLLQPFAAFVHPKPSKKGIALEASTEEKLISRCRQGDREAFSELVVVYEARVRQLAMRLVGDANLADDLAQQAFLNAFQAFSAFRGDAKFSTWIYRITVNVCGMHLRRARLIRFESDEVLAGSEDEAVNPLEKVNQTLLRERLEAALPKLGWSQRQALSLFYLEGVSYPEIARILDVPLGTVKAWISRGLVKLRQVLIEEKLQ